MSKRREARGFSLLEMLVVLVIIGLISGLVITNVMGRTEKAKQNAAKGQLQMVVGQVETYYLDNGRLPDRLDQLVPDYLKASNMQDPWGRDWQYQTPGQHSSFDVYSYGADNSPGGEGANADVNSWE